MERVKLDNRRILFNLLPAHVAQHFLMSNPRNMVSAATGAPVPALGGLTQRPSHTTCLLRVWPRLGGPHGHPQGQGGLGHQEALGTDEVPGMVASL